MPLFILTNGGGKLTIYQILCLLGIPSLIGSGFAYIMSRIKKNDAETKAVKLGIQALLRDRLYQCYDHYSERGCAPLHARDNFENMYNQYKSLGVDGVMADIHDRFFKLPLECEDEKEN